MNIPKVPDPNVDEACWQAQERARLAAGLTGGGEGGEVDAFDLRLARALRRAPPVDLPAGFARRVAGLARAQAVDATLEKRLLRGLVLVFGLSSAATVAWFGRGWVAALPGLLPGGADAVGWTTAAAACLLANWAWGALRDWRAAARADLA